MPVRTIHSGPNPRYFGHERGVTWYNLASDQFTGLNAITIPGTLRDSLYLLALVLEQETELSPTEIMTDTAAYTDTIFGQESRLRPARRSRVEQDQHAPHRRSLG